MKRAVIASVALLVSSVVPMPIPVFAAAATTMNPPPAWECPVDALGPAANGFHYDNAYIVAGQQNDYTIVSVDEFFVSQQLFGRIATIHVDFPVTVQCPIYNSQEKLIGRTVTNEVYWNFTITEVVCAPHITEAGIQLGRTEEDCVSGGSWGNHG